MKKEAEDGEISPYFGEKIKNKMSSNSIESERNKEKGEIKDKNSPLLNIMKAQTQNKNNK